MSEGLQPANDPTLITFTEHDLALFSAASGDRNPLHLNDEYARRTYYGEPVVFGCLGAMACLGHIGLPEGFAVTSLEATFLRPMFIGVPYRLEKKNQWGARLLDGSSPVVSLVIKGEPSQTEESPGEIEATPVFEHHKAMVRTEESIVPGLTVAGVYRCDGAVLHSLMTRWGVADRSLAVLLAWASYLVGMELPGESALFSKFALKFSGPVPGTIQYRAEVKSVDDRFGLVHSEFSLLAGDSAFASGNCSSHVRPMLPEPMLSEVEGESSDLRASSSLAGKVALIVGSSRGLGAAIQRALERRGAVVYGIARSTDGTNSQLLEVGDAADPETLRRLRARILNQHGHLDLLICNAAPALLPLRLEPNGVDRIGAYIERAVALTLAPLCEFLGLLNRTSGCAAIISSSAVEQPVKEWPHYIAAKQAVEALASVASLQHTKVATLIVRPPKLLTALTNTPMGRLGALSPATIANQIASRLEAPLEPGKTEILSFQETR